MERQPEKNKAPKKRARKKPPEVQPETVAGFSRFLHAINLMLEAASLKSKHNLTRHETLLLSIFRNGIMTRKEFELEFRKLLVIQPGDPSPDQAFVEAFEGLREKRLVRPSGKSVRITKEGHAELQRVSEQVDTVYDQLLEGLPRKERKTMQELMRKIGST
jgi:hypothetical protein